MRLSRCNRLFLHFVNVKAGSLEEQFELGSTEIGEVARSIGRVVRFDHLLPRALLDTHVEKTVTENPIEGSEHSWYVSPGKMVQRRATPDAIEVAVWEVELPQVSLAEIDVRCSPPGFREHAGRKIDADDLEAALVEPLAIAPRATTGVENPKPLGRSVQLDPPGERLACRIEINRKGPLGERRGNPIIGGNCRVAGHGPCQILLY